MMIQACKFEEGLIERDALVTALLTVLGIIVAEAVVSSFSEENWPKALDKATDSIKVDLKAIAKDRMNDPHSLALLRQMCQDKEVYN